MNRNEWEATHCRTGPRRGRATVRATDEMGEMGEMGEMATKALMRSTCRYCLCPIGLSRWSGWIELTFNGSHDMCSGTIAAIHEPTH